MEIKSNYNSLDKALQGLIHHAKCSSKFRAKQGHVYGVCKIDYKYLKDVWECQQGKCYYSNIPMIYQNHAWRISIERLDTQKGYIPGNVVLCCLEFNTRVGWTLDKVDAMLDILDEKITQHPVSFKKVPRYEVPTRSAKKIIVIDGDNNYKCKECKLVKPCHNFHTKSACCKSCVVKFKEKYNNTPYGRMKQIIRDISARAKLQAKNRGLTGFDLTFENLTEMFVAQKGLCAYSGIPMYFHNGTTHPWAISVERIDPLQGYTHKNVCLVCLEFNGPDQTARLTSSDSVSDYGSAGWTKLKFELFVAHVRYKKGLITPNELDDVIKKQDVVMDRPSYKRFVTIHDDVNPNNITFTPRVKNLYGRVYKLTSPSGLVYIGCSKVVDQEDTTIMFNIINRNISRLVIKEHEAHHDNGTPFKIDTLVYCTKDRLEHYKAHFIQEYDTIHPKGLNHSRKHTAETRAQISKTLIDNVKRQGHLGQELPMYIKYNDWKDRKGYSVVGHPTLGKKSFSTTIKTLEGVALVNVLNDILDQCIEYLNTS